MTKTKKIFIASLMLSLLVAMSFGLMGCGAVSKLTNNWSTAVKEFTLNQTQDTALKDLTITYTYPEGDDRADVTLTYAQMIAKDSGVTIHGFDTSKKTDAGKTLTCTIVYKGISTTFKYKVK